jgi:fido (protein-threonine AMPylation protein)
MDLPIYNDSMLRSSLQFADLARLKVADATPAWDKADQSIAQIEGAVDVASARAELKDLSKTALLNSHRVLFRGRSGAGELRGSEVRPLYRGQDCAPPEFIDRSLENLFSWVSAESFAEIHPIEKCALSITRIVDIWPFEFGNLTAALVFSNAFLERAGLTPFFVEKKHLQEFQTIIAQSLSIEMQPLVNAIYKTVRREMESLATR